MSESLHEVAPATIPSATALQQSSGRLLGQSLASDCTILACRGGRQWGVLTADPGVTTEKEEVVEVEEEKEDG